MSKTNTLAPASKDRKKALAQLRQRWEQIRSEALAQGAPALSEDQIAALADEARHEVRAEKALGKLPKTTIEQILEAENR